MCLQFFLNTTSPLYLYLDILSRHCVLGSIVCWDTYSDKDLSRASFSQLDKELGVMSIANQVKLGFLEGTSPELWPADIHLRGWAWSCQLEYPR
jgi:hypothetical protein